NRREAAISAIAKMTPACLLAAITTAIGFASLATAHSTVLKNFGWQAAIGVGFQYFCTLIALGTFMRFFAPPRYSGPLEERPGLTTRVVTAAGFAVARHPWLTVAASAVLLSVGAWAGARVRINSYSALETFPEQHPAVQTLRLVESKLAGIMPLEISLKTSKS